MKSALQLFLSCAFILLFTLGCEQKEPTYFEKRISFKVAGEYEESSPTGSVVQLSSLRAFADENSITILCDDGNDCGEMEISAVKKPIKGPQCDICQPLDVFYAGGLNFRVISRSDNLSATFSAKRIPPVFLNTFSALKGKQLTLNR